MQAPSPPPQPKPPAATSSSAAPTAAASTSSNNKKKRKAKKALPDILASLTETNFQTKMRARLETDGKEPEEAQVAFEVVFSAEEGDAAGDATFDLTELTLDQLRLLCKNCGVQYVNSCTKFQCRKALWVLADYKLKKQRDGIENAVVLDKATNNIVRITNIVFSHDFVDSFLALNDAKHRVDHETGEFLPRDFWVDVADAMNGAEEDDASALLVVLDEDDNYYDDIMDLNLRDFDVMTPDAIKKKVNHLLKIRKIVQNNMTVRSGEHDNDAFNFMEVAIRTAGNKRGVSALGAYYFHKRCDACRPEVLDDRFGVQMDEALRGNTDDNSTTKDFTTPKSRGNKRAYHAAFKEVGYMGREIAKQMKKANEATDRAQLCKLAQHLGKQEILESMFASLSSASGVGPE